MKDNTDRQTIINETKDTLERYDITNAMTLFVDEKGNSRRKYNLTKIIGLKVLNIMLSSPLKHKQLSIKETKKLCNILGRDIKTELLEYLAQRGISNVIEMLDYKSKHKNSHLINQNYINFLLNNNKKKGHLDIYRTLQFAKGLGWDIYEDIISVTNREKKNITDIIISMFRGNNNPLDYLQEFITEDEYLSLKKRLYKELINDINNRGIPRSLFKLMGRARLQNQLANMNLYRRLYMVLGEPTNQLTQRAKESLLSKWSEL